MIIVQPIQENGVVRYRVEDVGSLDEFDDGFRRGYQAACLLVSEDIDPRHPLVEDEVLARAGWSSPEALLNLARFAMDLSEPETLAYGSVCPETEELLAGTRGVVLKWLDHHRAQGRAEGLTVGRAHGRARGLRLGIRAACDLLGLKLTTSQRTLLYVLDAAALEELLSYLRRKRRWPRKTASFPPRHHRSEARRFEREEGFAEGHSIPLRLAIQTVYETRFGPLPPAVSAILEATTHIASLEAWLSRVGTSSAEELAALMTEPLGITRIRYEDWLNKLRAEWYADGLREALRRIHELRLGPLPPTLSAILDGTTDNVRLDAWIRLVSTCSAEEFAAALESAAAARPAS